MAIFEIAFLFLGSIIGAGFATGAEIVAFFGQFRLPVWCIASIVGLTMFLVITLEIFLFYPKTQINSEQQITSKEIKKNIKSTIFLDVVFVMIYQILFTAMTAGIIQITNIVTCVFFLNISIITVLFGFQKLSRLNTYIVLITIVLIISTALPHLPQFHPVPNYHWNNFYPTVFWALLYAGLNCFIFPELIIASARTHRRHTLLISGAITALSVTILVGLILTTIKHTKTVSAVIPLLSAIPHPVTTIIILLAIFTSQYSSLFAILQRTQRLFPQTRKKPLFVALIICSLAFIGSFCGFQQIIEFGYPIIGAFTCFYLLFSFLQQVWHFPRRHQH